MTTRQDKLKTDHNKARDLVRAVALAIEENPELKIIKTEQPIFSKKYRKTNYRILCGDKRVYSHKCECGPILDCDYIEPPTYSYYIRMKDSRGKTVLESYSDIQGRKLVTLLENERYKQRR